MQNFGRRLPLCVDNGDHDLEDRVFKSKYQFFDEIKCSFTVKTTLNALLTTGNPCTDLRETMTMSFINFLHTLVLLWDKSISMQSPSKYLDCLKI